MVSSTVENYLKQLYLDQRDQEDGTIAMGQLAAAMGVVPGTATAMVKALADAGLVDYEPRAGVRLSRKGEQLALHVLRRHRLVELFLVEILGLDWSVVHEEADALEHVVSERVLERIDAMLGNPSVDPHGDPIPTSKGHIHAPPQTSLADCPVGVCHRIARIVDQRPDFLKFAQRQGLIPGAEITVQEREPAAQSVSIVASGRPETSLGLAAAAKIMVDSPT